jgi:hypothetical protein
MVHGEIIMGEEHQMWQDWISRQIIEEEWDEAFYNNKTTNNHTIKFNTGSGEDIEMLRVSPDGFYVRGVKVEADAMEAEKVYLAFKQWLAWTALSTK